MMADPPYAYPLAIVISIPIVIFTIFGLAEFSRDFSAGSVVLILVCLVLDYFCIAVISAGIQDLLQLISSKIKENFYWVIVAFLWCIVISTSVYLRFATQT